jgi:hypothetical protein
VQKAEAMQKMAVFGLTLNPKQGVLHPEEAAFICTGHV